MKYMDIKFLTNDYILVWNLLFGASISEGVHKFKQKLWVNYKRQYNGIMNDNVEILQNLKDYIPDDDTIYNSVFKSSIFPIIKKNSEKYRLDLLKSFDKYKKDIKSILDELLRIDDKKVYNVIVVDPKLDVVDYNEAYSNTLVWGKSASEDEVKTLVDMLYYIVKSKMAGYKKDYQEIVDAIIELAIKDELHTRLSGKTKYLDGDPSLKFLKRQIYPYWLMYMGADKEKMLSYMMRDKIVFDASKYPIEKQLTKVDIYEFIDFCIKNQKYILKINDLEII